MIEYTVVRSNRKTIAVQIDKSLSVTVKAPLFVSDSVIKGFVSEKEEWITSHLEKMRKQTAEQKSIVKFTAEEINSFAAQALETIPAKAEKYARIIGVSYGRITIRNQRTRWGSCSGKGNLNFNLLLTLCPDEVADYVIIHELCHLKELNHSKAFWTLVEKYCPQYKSHRKWLKENGTELIRRLP